MKKKFWIAVDEDGETFIYDMKPNRIFHYWSGTNNEPVPNYLISHLNLTWESEPYEIEI